MHYMLQIIGFPEVEFADGEGPTAGEFIAWQRALNDAGALVNAGFLEDAQQATSVQLDRQGAQVITNGPFPESREYLGGWAIIDAPDLDAALVWATRCPGAKYGRVEIRTVAG